MKHNIKIATCYRCKRDIMSRETLWEFEIRGKHYHFCRQCTEEAKK